MGITDKILWNFRLRETGLTRVSLDPPASLSGTGGIEASRTVAVGRGGFPGDICARIRHRQPLGNVTSDFAFRESKLKRDYRPLREKGTRE